MTSSPDARPNGVDELQRWQKLPGARERAGDCYNFLHVRALYDLLEKLACVLVWLGICGRKQA